MPRAITATRGPRCFRLTPTACSRNRACCRRRRVAGSGTRGSLAEEAGPRWSRLSHFAAGPPKSRPCYGIRVCWRHNTAEEGEMITASIPARSLTAFALLLLISGLAAAQVQQVYRYIDVDGRVVYSDKPPPPGAKDAQAKRIGGNSIETSDLSFATAQAQERYPVTLYTFACGVICDSARGLINKRGVPHTVIDVSQSDGADRLKRLTGGLEGPTMKVGGQQALDFT